MISYHENECFRYLNMHGFCELKIGIFLIRYLTLICRIFMSRTWLATFKGIRKGLFNRIMYLNFFSNHKDTVQLVIMVKILLLKNNIILYGNFLKFHAKILWNNNYENPTILIKAFELKRYIVGFSSLYIDILHQVLENSETLNYFFNTPSNIRK